MFSSLFGSQSLLLEIYYLFTYSDGESTYEEITCFQSICKEMNISKEIQDEIINKYSSNANITYECIVGKITQYLESNFWIKNDKRKQASFIWNLINIGFADKDFSENERKILSFVIDYLGFNKTAFNDYIDTAETILMLTNEKEWIKTTNKTYDEINAKVTKIDELIKKLGDKVKTDISEIEIA